MRLAWRAVQVEIENVFAEAGFCGAGFDAGEIDFGGGKFLENG